MSGGWGTGKDLVPLGQRRADAPEEPRRTPGRKDTRTWCKGKVGREHRPEIVWPPNAGSWLGGCRPAEDWMQREWSCNHVERCSACEKVLRDGWQLEPGECPDFRPSE